MCKVTKHVKEMFTGNNTFNDFRGLFYYTYLELMKWE